MTESRRRTTETICSGEGCQEVAVYLLMDAPFCEFHYGPPNRELGIDEPDRRIRNETKQGR